jgi:type I restriction enzyme S subunit
MMDYVNLSDVCEIVAGQSPPSSTYNKNASGLPFFQGKADFGELYPNIRMWCSEPKKVSFPNDILISVRAPVGPTNINNVEACIGRGLSAIRCSDAIALPFLLHFLRYNEEKIADKGTGSTFKAITQKELRVLQIPLPPLSVQQKIAAILDAADALKQKDQALIAKYDELTQSLFLDMFGDPVNNPKGWDKGEFGSFIDVLTDYHANGSYEVLKKNVVLKNTEDYALMVRTTDLEHNNFSKDVIHISKHAYDYLKKSKVFGGEIIVSKIGSAGKVFMMPHLGKPVSLGMNAFLLRFNKNLNNVFVYYLLISKFGEMEIGKRIKGAVTKTIRKDALREINIIAPPITLQNQFAERIQAIEYQKQQAQATLQKSEDLFNCLLQKAFKGELVS